MHHFLEVLDGNSVNLVCLEGLLEEGFHFISLVLLIVTVGRNACLLGN